MTTTDNMVIRGCSSGNVWDHENAFYWFSHPTRMGKLLSHFELYRRIIDLPGEVVELGVYKGASLIRFATFRSLLENDFARRIVGFDAFGKFPEDTIGGDSAFVRRFEEAGGDGLSEEEIAGLMERKGFRNVELIEGNVLQTVPEYVSRHPELRIAMLHLDMDVREPTARALDVLYSRVVPGGLIVFDDYGTVAGETAAVDEFVAAQQQTLMKAPYYSVPAYMRKP